MRPSAAGIINVNSQWVSAEVNKRKYKKKVFGFAHNIFSISEKQTHMFKSYFYSYSIEEVLLVTCQY